MPRFCFDRFCLDSDQKLLSRGGDPVRLTPRAYRLLEFLVVQRAKAVSKRDLLQHVWAGAIVEEANLKTLVLEIRKALEERGGSEDVIRTVYGYGYAFAGSVQVDEGTVSAPLVALRWEHGVAQLPAGVHTIGRSAACAVVIDAPSVSREHARLTVSRDLLRLEDLGSKNGTFAGTRRIDAPVDLLDTCRITIGEIAIDISRLGKEESTETLA